jgi:hypothetical protein
MGGRDRSTNPRRTPRGTPASILGRRTRSTSSWPILNANRPGRVALDANVAIPGNSEPRGPITVCLEPCGAAQARLVGSDGIPVAGHVPREMIITMVNTPGSPYHAAPDTAGLLFAAEPDLKQFDSARRFCGLSSKYRRNACPFCLVVDHGVVSSWSDNSRCAVAHGSGSLRSAFPMSHKR